MTMIKIFKTTTVALAAATFITASFLAGAASAADGHAPLQASARGFGGGMGSGMSMRTVPPTVSPLSGPHKSGPAPVALKRRMTLGLGCYEARYRQLRAAGQDDPLASAGAALICG